MDDRTDHQNERPGMIELQAESVKILILPSGRTARIRRGKGRDLKNAQRVAGRDTDGILYALIAQTVTIDDKPLLYEDVLDELDADDVLALQTEIFSRLGNALPSPPRSPGSFNSGSERAN